MNRACVDQNMCRPGHVDRGWFEQDMCRSGLLSIRTCVDQDMFRQDMCRSGYVSIRTWGRRLEGGRGKIQGMRQRARWLPERFPQLRHKPEPVPLQLSGFCLSCVCLRVTVPADLVLNLNNNPPPPPPPLSPRSPSRTEQVFSK